MTRIKAQMLLFKQPSTNFQVPSFKHQFSKTAKNKCSLQLCFVLSPSLFLIITILKQVNVPQFLKQLSI